jgi:2-hydroxy-3-oxopropionate reductase
MTETPLKLGFIGLGPMGAHMAGHLIKAGHQLFVYTLGKVPPLVADSSATFCTRARGVAERADIVFITVPDAPGVENALVNENGVAAGLSKGKIVVDMCSISPIASKAFAQKINAIGCEYLDAPVSGGEVGARNATLSIMVRGPQATFEKIKPLFELMGRASRWSPSRVIVAGTDASPASVVAACGAVLSALQRPGDTARASLQTANR